VSVFQANNNSKSNKGGHVTYCIGILLDEGVVLASDSRTNAGIDRVSTFR
jgi:20S proteasome alpha/beta subunit